MGDGRLAALAVQILPREAGCSDVLCLLLALAVESSGYVFVRTLAGARFGRQPRAVERWIARGDLMLSHLRALGFF